MDMINLVQILINLSQTLGPVQRLLSGLAYIIGFVFIFSGIGKFYKLAATPRGSGSQAAFTPFAYIVVGAVLIFIPSTFQVLSSTVFGAGSVLQYATPNPIDVTSAMILLIQTAGLVWFIRGCVLLVTSSQPGAKEGPKGMVFLCAGILAMNIESTAAMINVIVAKLVAYT